MAAYQHRLEQRADKLAAAMKARVQALSTGITPPGSRPPFTQTFGKDRALDTLLTHWQHPATQQWVQSLPPMDQLSLHNALSQRILERGLMPATAQPDGMSITGGAEANRASMMGVNQLAAPQFQAIRNVS